MRASKNGHVDAVSLLLASGADINAKDKVSTCECTDVSVSCLCVCLSACLCLSMSCIVGFMLLLSITICTSRSAIIAIELIPVMVGRVIGKMDCSYGGL